MAEIKSIFNFLRDYNGLLNPIVTEIDRQIWNYEILSVPQIEELWSIKWLFDTTLTRKEVII